MKKGTPTNVVSNGTWTNQQGKTFYKWNVTMDNGDFGGAMTGAENQDKWVVGKEVTYTSETKGNFTNFKLVEDKQSSGGGKKSSDEIIVAQTCIKATCELLAEKQGSNSAKVEDVIAYSEKLFQWVMSKKV